MNKLQNEKMEFTEKQKEILYCIFIVAVIVIIAFGDQIVLKFIEHHPNPNDRVFGETEKNHQEYTISFLQELTVEDVIKKIEQKETFFLLSSRDSCVTCAMMLNDLENVLKDNNQTGYFINHEKIKKESISYQKWIKDDEMLAKNLSYTPYFMYYKDGVLERSLVGKPTKEKLQAFILKEN